MSVLSNWPHGTHEIHVTWSDGVHPVEERVYTFDVNNPTYGQVPPDPDVEQFKISYPNTNIVLLQREIRCENLGIYSYNGVGDAKTHATHLVPDRNSDHTNYGADDYTEVGHYGQERRTLIRWDLSMIPTGAVVEKAVMKLFMFETAQPKQRYAYKVLRPWGEGRGHGSYYLNPALRILDGECAWRYCEYPTEWGTWGCSEAGVDVEGTETAQSYCDDQVASEDLDDVWVKWDVTSAAQGWVSTPAANYGLLLRVPNAESWAQFRTSEYADALFRPRLVVVLSNVNVPPVARATATPDSGAWDLDVTFDASTSSDFEGPVALYEYDFDYDMQIFTADASGAALTSTAHTYTSSKTYMAAVRVTDGDGTTNTTTVPVTVWGPYSISGNVSDTLEGVTLTMLGSASRQATTDASGDYVFDRLDDGTYTIIPRLFPYAFTPAEQTVTIAGADLLGVDFAAVLQPTVTIAATAGTGGSIDPAGDVLVVEGDDKTFAITPDFGYYILDVLVDAGSVGAVSEYTFTNVMANRTIEAQFAAIPAYVLVDFGPTVGSDTYGLAGWDTTIKDIYTTNINTTPAGMHQNAGPNGGYDYQGVTGTPRDFAVGEKVYAFWYNDSVTETLIVTPQISFDDPDRRVSGIGGSWHGMSAVTLEPGAVGWTVFEFTAATAGAYSLVNVNNNFDSFDLICDKIILHEVVTPVQPGGGEGGGGGSCGGAGTPALAALLLLAWCGARRKGNRRGGA